MRQGRGFPGTLDDRLAVERTVEDPQGDGSVESFTGLPKAPPLNLMALLRRTQFVTLKDLRRQDQFTVPRGEFVGHSTFLAQGIPG